ncbi:MAG: histidine phosphatase family protein [Asgard group archaeon]|nr:histidine phosphatase family protein [Asgard group archaeon]
MKVILARHGESEANRLGIIQGHSDYPLSDLGFKQAKELAEWLSINQKNLDGIYSSDLTRAVDTAIIIAKELGNKDIIFDHRLREFNLGLFQDRETASLTQKEQDYLDSFLENTFEKIPNGESFEEMKTRVREAFFEIIAKHEKTDTILIIGHGGTLYQIIALILKFNLDLKKEWFGNCQRTEIVLNHKTNKWSLITFNNKSIKSLLDEKSQ